MAYKSKRAKACDITPKVKKIVWERDSGCCILCGSTQAMPNAHFIPRSHGGLGIEQNIITLCQSCHHRFDNTTERGDIYAYIKSYLQRMYKYEDWSEEKLIYKSGGNYGKDSRW